MKRVSNARNPYPYAETSENYSIASPFGKKEDVRKDLLDPGMDKKYWKFAIKQVKALCREIYHMLESFIIISIRFRSIRLLSYFICVFSNSCRVLNEVASTQRVQC